MSAYHKMRVALFLSCPAFEDFFDQIGITRQDYIETYQNDWSFGLIRLLAQHDVETTIYHFSREIHNIEEHVHTPTGCTIKFFPMPLLERLQALARGHHLLSTYLASLSPLVLRDLARQRPDVIYVQEYEWGRFDILVMFGRLLRIPVIAQHHGADGKYGGRGASVRRWAIRRASKLLCLNHSEYQRATHRYDGLDDGKLEVLYNSVDPSRFYPVDKELAKTELGLPLDRRYLLFVGRLHPHKGIPYLLEAFARIQPEFPDTTLLLVGTGPLENELQTLVVERGWQRIGFEGWVTSQDRLRLYMAACEFIVMSSVREALPLSTIQAMACGKPVIATSVDGLVEQIDKGENGLLVPPKDVEALAQGMSYLLDNPERCDAMGRAASETFEARFSAGVIGQRLSEILKEVSNQL